MAADSRFAEEHQKLGLYLHVLEVNMKAVAFKVANSGVPTLEIQNGRLVHFLIVRRHTIRS